MKFANGYTPANTGKGKDLTGARFGRLVVTEKSVAGTKSTKAQWRCLCDCGNVVVIEQGNLERRQKSCGCLRREVSAATHTKEDPVTKHPLFRTWVSMKSRCTHHSRDNFKYYGGLGVSVCDRWQSFESFASDMGERPPGKTLDRFPDNNGNYEPGNCRWATAVEQRANRRDSINRNYGPISDLAYVGKAA